MCDKAIKAKDARIAQLEAALTQALMKAEASVKQPSKPKTQIHSQRVSVESNKENLGSLANGQPQNVRLEDFLRKKSPSNPVNGKPASAAAKQEGNFGTASARVLVPAQIEFNHKLVTSTMGQRPATSAGYSRAEAEVSKSRFKTQSIFGDNLSEMFRKKKNASSVLAKEKQSIGSISKQLSINTPKFDFPASVLRPESPVGGEGVRTSKSVEKRTEIEGILLRLLEEHKETSPAQDNFLNKLNFIERAIKR